MHQETHVHSNPTQKAKVFCVKADENGYATIHEGAVWLSSSSAMVELQKEHADNPDSPYKTYDFKTHPYWLEITDANPLPICGPEDELLLSTLEV